MRARARSSTAKGGKGEKGHTRRKSITATLAGALASTRACQRIIVRALGRDGVDFVRTLRHCVQLHCESSSVAKRFKSDVFKFLAQWIVYEREGRFTPGQIGALQKPAMRVTLMIVVALHRHIKLDHTRTNGAVTARRHSDDASHARTRVRATRAKLEWMKYRLSKVDDTLQQLSLENEGKGSNANGRLSSKDDDGRDDDGSSAAGGAAKDGSSAAGGAAKDGSSAAGGAAKESATQRAETVDPVDEIIEMEDILESLAASLTSIRSDTSLWSELLQEGPPTGKTLGDSIRLFGLAFHALLSPMLEKSDSDRLREMVDFASSESFLDAVLTKEQFAEHRGVLYRSLTQKDTNFGISTAVPATPRTARGRAPTGTYNGTAASHGSTSSHGASGGGISTEAPKGPEMRKRSSLFGSLKNDSDLCEISEEISSDSSDSSRRSSSSR